METKILIRIGTWMLVYFKEENGDFGLKIRRAFKK